MYHLICHLVIRGPPCHQVGARKPGGLLLRERADHTCAVTTDYVVNKNQQIVTPGG